MHTVKFLIHLIENHQVLVYFFIYLGLVFEGDVVLMVSGILLHLNAIDIFPTLVFVSLGGVSKTLLGYQIGDLLHNRWHKTRVFKYLEKRVSHVMPNFEHKPFWSIFISKFITGVNQVVIIFAGYKGIDFKKYLKAEISSTILWIPIFLSLGYFFSYTAINVSREIWKFSMIVIILIISVIVLDRLLGWAYELFEEFYDKQ